MGDHEEERGIQNFKSRLSASQWETKHFGSWTQKLVIQMKDHLGVRAKHQWPYAERQVVDWVVRATMDHGINKHTGLYSTSYSCSLDDSIIALQMYCWHCQHHRLETDIRSISIDDTKNPKVYLNMMLSVYQMLLSDKLKGEFRHDS
jgi:hypothetical protein